MLIFDGLFFSEQFIIVIIIMQCIVCYMYEEGITDWDHAYPIYPSYNQAGIYMFPVYYMLLGIVTILLTF